jgi:dihydroorotase
MSGQFGYADSFGGRLNGSERLLCELTLKDGRVVWDWNGRAGTDYQDMDPTYGVRPGEYLVMPPGA